jgi:MoxR-like ATPase
MKQEEKNEAVAAQESFLAYAGDGSEVLEQYKLLDDPEKYRVDKELRHAVNVALILGQPLLVTGQPGTGKTQLAKRIAYELKLSKELFPLTFHTKSTSSAKDLFYQYDALSHFHDAQIKRDQNEQLTPHPYITYEALGQAILLSLAPGDDQRSQVNQYLPEDLQDKGPIRSVVLIDEIDKAPRDLPNDVLNEIENMTFTIRELPDEKAKKPAMTFTADKRYKPIVLITSNSERDLPDAFLRRCVYYNIEFPGETLLNEIVRERLALVFLTPERRRDAVSLFFKIRRDLKDLRKSPATAELLAWVRVLEKQKLDVTEGRADELRATYSALAKNPDDLDAIRKESDKLVKELIKDKETRQQDFETAPSEIKPS